MKGMRRQGLPQLLAQRNTAMADGSILGKNFEAFMADYHSEISELENRIEELEMMKVGGKVASIPVSTIVF
ncbi:hypothetical protein M569_14300 [Genlisea aurea]|uniref:Uncharacterized protein n=1 Tax=Genlisea aurea TaxID=192259 RepID=S8DCH2_9LAMI|nr:hypothetical protein M569_14300 [Genlisea aurea]